jgi:hypothetical protein
MIQTSKEQKYCHRHEWPSTGFRLEIGFIDHLCTRHVTTLNYSAVAIPHTLQITAAHAASFQLSVPSPVVPW